MDLNPKDVQIVVKLVDVYMSMEIEKKSLFLRLLIHKVEDDDIDFDGEGIEENEISS